MTVERESQDRPAAPGPSVPTATSPEAGRSVEAPVRSVGWGAFFFVVAAMVLALDVFAWLQRGRQGWPQSSPFLVPWLAYFGRQLLARPALQAVLEDPRAPVIYLRSFSQESLEAAIQGGRAGQLPAETRLVPGLERVGPVLAIGRPGERLTVPGAARLYVGDDDWKQVALSLMRQAVLVLVRADAGQVGPGLAWEIATAHEAVPPERLVIWLPSRLDAQQFEKLRALVHATTGSELPPAPAMGGFLRFGPSLQTHWTASLDDVPSVPRPAASAQRPAAPSPLSSLLSELRAHEVAPPSFGLHHWTWLIGLPWLVVVVGGGVLFSTQTGRGGPLAAALLEATFVAFLALVLAFVCHVKWPHQRVGSSLIVAALMAADTSWYVMRHWPSRAEQEEAAGVVASRICGKAFACLPADLREAEIEQCVVTQRDQMGRGGLALHYVQQTALTACEALECEAFLDCMDREASMLTLPAQEKRRLLALICRALREAPSQDPRSAAWAEVERELEALKNPPLAQALVEEGRRSCATGER